jgi:hypothetical protein
MRWLVLLAVIANALAFIAPAARIVVQRTLRAGEASDDKVRTAQYSSALLICWLV